MGKAVKLGLAFCPRTSPRAISSCHYDVWGKRCGKPFTRRSRALSEVGRGHLSHGLVQDPALGTGVRFRGKAFVLQGPGF